MNGSVKSTPLFVDHMLLYNKNERTHALLGRSMGPFTNSYQATPNLVNSPSAMMMATQMSAMITVQRFRFFSATPEEPAFCVRPPPNMSGQAAALAFVHEDEQGKQQTEHNQHNLQNQLDYSHGEPPNFNTVVQCTASSRKSVQNQLLSCEDVVAIVFLQIVVSSSTSRAAPPMRKPSTSGSSISSTQFFEDTEPPYSTRTVCATWSPNDFARSTRKAWRRPALSAV